MQTQFKCVNKMWELKEKNSFSHLKEIWEQGPTTITIILIVKAIVIIIIHLLYLHVHLYSSHMYTWLYSTFQIQKFTKFIRAAKLPMMFMMLHLIQIFFFSHRSATVSSLTLSICLNILSTLFSGVSSSFGKSIILPCEKNKEYYITHLKREIYISNNKKQ